MKGRGRSPPARPLRWSLPPLRGDTPAMPPVAGTVNGEVKVKKDWEIKKLEDVCEFLDSRRKPITANKRTKGLIPYYGATGILDYVADFLFDEELILLGEDGAKWGPGDNSAFRISGKTWVNNHAHVLKPKNMNYDWIIYYLNYSDLMKFVKGATVPKLNQENARNIQIPVPSLEEQKRIVKILDEKFAQLESLKANAQTNLQNAKDLFQSQLTKAFSNTTWEKKRLQDCTSIIGDGLHGTPKYDENGNYYFINGSNLTITDIVFTPETKRVNETEYQKYKVELNENTVFLSINGSTLGKRTAFYNNEPVILGKSACYINVKSNTLNKYFLRHFLSSDIFQEYAWKEKTGAAIPNLGLKAMRDLKIPLPPLHEQKRIVKELDTLSEKVLQLQEIYTKQIANCNELKQSYLQKAFEGEL